MGAFADTFKAQPSNPLKEEPGVAQQPEQKPAVTAGQAIRDVVTAPAAGAAKAVDATAGLLQDVGGVVVEAISEARPGDQPGVEFGPELTDEARARAEAKWPTKEDVEFQMEKLHTPTMAPRQTFVGEAVEGVSQFATDFVLLGKLTKLKNAGGAWRWVDASVRGAAADFAAFDETQAGLTNLLQDSFGVGEDSAILQWLRIEEDDPWYEVRAKRAIEGLGLGVGADLLVYGLAKGVRSIRNAMKTGDEAAVETAQREAAEAVEALQTVKQTGEELADREAVDVAIASDDVMREIDDPAKLSEAAETMKRLQDDTVEYFREGLYRVSQGKAALSDVFSSMPINPAKLMDQDAAASLDAMSDTFFANRSIFEESISFDEVRAAAGSLTGKSPQELWASLKALNQGDPAMAMATIWYSKGIAEQLGKDAALAAKHAINTGDEALQAEALMKTAAAMQWLEDIKAVTSTAARITSSGRMKTPVAERVARQLETLKQVRPDDPQAVLKVIADAGREPNVLMRILRAFGSGKTIDTINTVWINAILSGPKTHLINVSSNVAMQVLRSAEGAAGAALRGDWRSAKLEAMTGWGTIQYIGDAFHYARESLNRNSTILDPAGIRQLEDASEGILEDATRAGAAGQAAEAFFTAPGRMLTAEDEFFKQLSFRSRLRSLAVEAAMDKNLSMKKTIVLDDGTRTSAFDMYVEDAFAKGFDETGAANMNSPLAKQAMDYSREVTFTAPLNEAGEFASPMLSRNGTTIGGAVQSFIHEVPVARQFLPFIRTPTNLLRQTLQRTPALGMLQHQMRRDWATGNPRLRAAVLGKQMSGVAILGTALTLAESGRLTGSGPSDPAMRKQWYEAGWRPQSVKVGSGEDAKWVDIRRLEPWGTILGTMGTIAELTQAAPPNERQELFAAGTLGLGEYAWALKSTVMSKTWLTGLEELTTALMSGESWEIERWAQSRSASFTPYSSLWRQVNQDPVLREVDGFGDAFKSQLPGFSRTLPAKYNVFGQPVTRTGDLEDRNMTVLEKLSPIGPHDVNRSVVFEQMIASGHAWGPPPERYGGLKLREFKLPDGTSAYDEWNRLIREGDMLEDVREVVTSEKYQEATPTLDPGEGETKVQGMRQVMLSKRIDGHRRKAFGKLIRNKSLKNENGVPLKDAVRFDTKARKEWLRGRGDIETLLQD